MPVTKVDQPAYWLSGWLESKKVDTAERAASLLSDQSELNEMRDVAAQWSASVGTYKPVGSNLVAGTGLRLDDRLTCPNPTCRRQQVDVLFRHAWHYFDQVLLCDGAGNLLLAPPAHWNREVLLRALLQQIELVMYIDQIGARDLVNFYPKPDMQTFDFNRVVAPERRPEWLRAWREVGDYLLTKEFYEIEEIKPNHFHVTFTDPTLNITAGYDMVQTSGDSSEEALRKKVAHNLMHFHMDYLTEDLWATYKLNGSLGSTVWSHERVLSQVSKNPGASDVLFRLSLPSLAHVPINELIAIREHEGGSFAAFRGALTRATKELATGGHSDNPEDLATEISRDIIEPEIARLNQRLNTAQRALTRKATFSVVLSALATTCGLLMGLPPSVATAAGATCLTTGAGGAVAKYLDEKQAIELSDMYFLWKALGHAG